MMMMIASNSWPRKGSKQKGRGSVSMEEFEGRRKELLTMGERCNPVSNVLQYM